MIGLLMISFKNAQTQKFSFTFGSIAKVNIKLLITLICLAFIGTSIYGNFETLSKQTITFKVILWLIGGAILSFLSIIFNAYAWKFLINSIGCNSNKLNIIKVFLNTNIYKYLPGGIWHFVSRYNILRSKFSNQKSVEAILLEPLLMLVAGLIFVPFRSLNIYLFVLCWSSALLFLTGLRKFIIKNLMAMKAKMFDNNKINARNIIENSGNISVNIFYPYKSLFIEILFILFRFFGFYCCLNAFSIDLLISHGLLISSFSLAWIIGLIVPAAPGGIGVFESVILFGLGSQLPEAPLLASLLCYRLVSTLSDIFAALVYPTKRLLSF